MRPRSHAPNSHIRRSTRPTHLLCPRPEKDDKGELRKDQFWTYYMEAMGSKIIFMFALTPHVSEELYQAQPFR